MNGLQTTNVIYEIYKEHPDKLVGVYVLVKLYETADNELIDKITDATNTQSPINYRDKISTRRFNEFTKEVFANAGIGYLSKRGETFDNQLSISLQKSVHSETVLKFWYATFYELPERAKSAKSKVLEELFDATTNKNNKLNKLFGGDKDSPIYQQLLEAFWIYDYVVWQRQRREHHHDFLDFVLFADELLAYGIYKAFKKSGGYDKEKLLEYYWLVHQAIHECTQREQMAKTHYQMTYSHSSYFKSAVSRIDLNKALEFSEDILY